MCRSRQILVGAKQFCPDYSKPFRKILGLQKKVGRYVKNLFMSIRVPLFSNQSMLGAIFAQIFWVFQNVLRYFAWILEDFDQILWNFAWIFSKSKLFGVQLHPYTPPPTPVHQMPLNFLVVSMVPCTLYYVTSEDMYGL